MEGGDNLRGNGFAAGLPFSVHEISETKNVPVPVLKGNIQNLAPVLVILFGILWYFLGKLLPVLVFTRAAPPAHQHQ